MRQCIGSRHTVDECDVCLSNICDRCIDYSEGVVIIKLTEMHRVTGKGK